jgi:YebC/PmpR family DNA-binding regulatory protein
MGRKWNNIKEKKASQDKQRGQIYSKTLRDVTVAAKKGGGDPDSNFLLKLALQKCRTFNVPKDNVDRAVKKGLGGDQEDYFDITYEGHGPSGVAVFVDATTNNPTRTIANVRSYFRKVGGDIGKDGCLQFLFEQKSVFELPPPPKTPKFDEDSFTLEMIDAGAEDIEIEPDGITITASREDFGRIHKKLEELKIEAKEAGLERIPTSYKKLTKEDFDSLMKLINLLEDDEDVQKVFHNTEYDPELDQ